MFVALFFAVFISIPVVSMVWKKSYSVVTNENTITISLIKLKGFSMACTIWAIIALFALIANYLDEPIFFEQRGDLFGIAIMVCFGLAIFLFSFAVPNKAFDLGQKTLTIGTSVYPFQDFSHLRYGFATGGAKGNELSVVLHNGKILRLMLSDNKEELKVVNKLLHEKLSLNTKARKADGLFNYIEIDTDYAK